MKHNYKELNNTLFAALDNIPEEKSISLRELISMCFPDYKYVSSFYSEDTKKHHNPYSFFNGEKWEKLELLDFAFDFFKTAKKSKFFLDGTKYTGGFYGTTENMSFFVRRKPISKRIIFQVQEYPVKNEVEESKTKQLKIYYDGSVKFQTIKNIGIVIREYGIEKNTGHIADNEKMCTKTFGGTYFINKQIVEKIKNIYNENVEIIKTLPQNLSNESCNGNFQEFSFGTKKITCQNISNKSEDDRTILRIFADIRNIIDSLTPESEWPILWNEFRFLHK